MVILKEIYDNNWGNIRVGQELLAATDSPHDGCLELNKNIGHGPGYQIVYIEDNLGDVFVQK